MQITGRPAAFNACQSHVDVGPLSRPILDACGARVRMNEIRAPGSDGTSASVTTRPKLFKTQTEVLRSETSKATYWSTASLPKLATTPNLVGIHLGRKVAAPITPCVTTPLEHIMRQPGRVFSRAQLLDGVWGGTATIKPAAARPAWARRSGGRDFCFGRTHFRRKLGWPFVHEGIP